MMEETDRESLTRRAFLTGSACAVGGALTGCRLFAENPTPEEDALDVVQRETDLVTPKTYSAYKSDGQTRGFAALEKLERGFANVLAEIEKTAVGDVPAVWHVYNMGLIVKTRESLFSIDLVHYRACELAPKLNFALITHNHGDHYQPAFYGAMNRAGKTVVNNFIDNFGAKDRSGMGGYTRAEKVFRLRDVEVRTSLTDHSRYLVDYTTAFEIRVGGWRMLHTGDCWNVGKVNPVWGRPDLWVLSPGCGIDIVAGARKFRPSRIALCHLWELGHAKNRIPTSKARNSQAKVQAEGCTAIIPTWGERIV